METWLLQWCFVFFFLFSNHRTCGLSQPSCPHDQSLALIQFNNSFSIHCSDGWEYCYNVPKAKTVSWKEGTDCCLWDGVTCDAETGNVIGLDLSSSCLVGPFPSNSTLFLFRHLRQLNLAYNYFSMSPVASQFGELTSLTHLNISWSGFSGEVPLEISHLSKLSSLDLSGMFGGLMLEGHVFESVVGNLTQLRHLVLSDVIMFSVEPASFLNMSSYITTLILEGNGLQGKFPEDVFRFPNLEKLCVNDGFLFPNDLEKLCINGFHFPDLEKFCLDYFHGGHPENFIFKIEVYPLEIKLPKTNWSGPLKSLEVSSSYLQELPDSIGNLRSLEMLDLSYSSLTGSIPAALGNLTQLKHLDLSENNLSGLFPISVFNLTQLGFLDLSGNNLSGLLPISVFNLTQLGFLDLSRNNLSGLLPISVFNLTQLGFLDLSRNNLIGSLPSRVSRLSRLRLLDLHGNFLSGRVQSWLFSVPSLVVLSLHDNKLTGPMEQFDKVVPLEYVDLSNNEIQGPIPAAFFQLVNLTVLDLSSNKLSGNFEMDKLSKLSKLQKLSFSNNALLSLSSASNVHYSLPYLLSLNLSSCNISEFPNFVRNLEGLTSLDLSYNRIRVIEADKFLKLKSLESLVLSHNSPLSLTNNNNLSVVLPNLSSLLLSSCKITEFSNFLTTQEGLMTLDLSDNSIQGQITKQERNWGTNLQYVDLSDNLLTVVEYSSWKNLQVLKLGSNLLEGPLLPPPPSASVLLLSDNRLTGEIPSTICNLNSSKMDVVLDLSRNNLSGAIPRCLGLRNISVLDLHMNHLHGNIPDFCSEGNYRLQTLNLNKNDFDGPLPKSFAYCHHLEVLNVGNNKINDTFPHWLGTLPQLQVLVLRANYFHGQIIHLENGSQFSTLRILDLSHNEFSGFLLFKSFKGMMSLANVQMGYMEGEYYRDSMVVTMKGVDIELERILTIFATLDMSCNRFQGTITETIGNLVSLQVLNFSHNHLSGHIPSSLGNVTALESLDLSCNELVGEIPSKLIDLLFLEVLNLSENHLVGLIPQGNQFNTFLNDSYIGNPGLCGFPVSKSCGHSEPRAPGIYQHDDDDYAFRLDWKFVMMGYGCGLVFGISAGYIMMTIRKPKWLVGMVQRAGSTVLRRFNRYD
ncbi:hypothetical protein V6N11_068830 [Hibiscus sabdariffa]|uniref:Leucine-rich repeat-containing N-terminal plant-type domain-containing protein n=1 Tax=Hibiscus sabdariffa TaxID=183260 RepID=A0ABR2PB92_9ROSI